MSKGYIRNRTRTPRQSKGKVDKNRLANRATRVIAKQKNLTKVTVAIEDQVDRRRKIDLNCILSKGSIKRALHKLGYNCRARAVTIP